MKYFDVRDKLIQQACVEDIRHFVPAIKEIYVLVHRVACQNAPIPCSPECARAQRLACRLPEIRADDEAEGLL